MQLETWRYQVNVATHNLWDKGRHNYLCSLVYLRQLTCNDKLIDSFKTSYLRREIHTTIDLYWGLDGKAKAAMSTGLCKNVDCRLTNFIL